MLIPRRLLFLSLRLAIRAGSRREQPWESALRRLIAHAALACDRVSGLSSGFSVYLDADKTTQHKSDRHDATQ